jgi:hypothetical protein
MQASASTLWAEDPDRGRCPVRTLSAILAAALWRIRANVVKVRYEEC